MPVHGYVGGWGTGKSYAAVVDARKACLRYRVPLVTNLEIRYPESDGIEVITVESIEDIMDAQNCVILIDEIGIMMPSRFFAKVMAKTAFRWAQLRKFRVFEVFWTSQSIARVDTLVRELTWDVCEMRSFRILGFFLGQVVTGLGLGSAAKQKVGVRFYRVSKKVYSWYDTMAVIGNKHLLEE